MTDLREHINSLADWVLVLPLIVFSLLGFVGHIASLVLFRGLEIAAVFPVLGKFDELSVRIY